MDFTAAKFRYTPRHPELMPSLFPELVDDPHGDRAGVLKQVSEHLDNRDRNLEDYLDRLPGASTGGSAVESGHMSQGAATISAGLTPVVITNYLGPNISEHYNDWVSADANAGTYTAVQECWLFTNLWVWWDVSVAAGEGLETAILLNGDPYDGFRTRDTPGVQAWGDDDWMQQVSAMNHLSPGDVISSQVRNVNNTSTFARADFGNIVLHMSTGV